eukprot:CAMPEP_0184855676 /NCGR_PEP_ID=MMETSP0580-20130426/837_1 /TAXON_ID=1118495 /ORGANISM="Dactyliosolen fragilissimus" /LENGTH=371 /DNA_ID=CAMNT_0027350241 /DNA_START=209 /DNA_END=1324 /DNA_ORIENTATION=+
MFLLVIVVSTFIKTALSFHISNEVLQIRSLSSTLHSNELNESQRGQFFESKKIKEDVGKIPFIVERLEKVDKKDRNEISDLVIGVFFEEEAELNLSPEERKPLTPWKVMQLAYLKNLQRGDLQGKRFELGKGLSSDMFVAREVIVGNSSPYIIQRDDGYDESIDVINPNTIINGQCLPKIEALSEDLTYVRGKVIGFVDVTEKSYGLAGSDLIVMEEKATINNLGKGNEADFNWDASSKTKENRSFRPILTNLVVSEDARKSGVGSKLVEICEDTVLNQWPSNHYEMILEVESENINAQRFYEKRGYKALFSDPTGRRYDTSGLLLSKVRSTKICFRKDLRLQKAKATSSMKGNSIDIQSMFSGMLQSFFG